MEEERPALEPSVRFRDIDGHVVSRLLRAERNPFECLCLGVPSEVLQFQSALEDVPVGRKELRHAAFFMERQKRDAGWSYADT